MRINIYPTLAAVFTSAAILASAIASAAEWEINPQVSVKAGYNDNIRLNTDNELSSTEAVISPRVTFSRKTPASDLSSTVIANVRRYLDESDLDDETASLNLNALRRMERSTLGLGLNLTRDTTLDSQLEETGLVFDRVNRFRTSVDPSWTYSFSDRTFLQLGYGYSDVKYEDNADAGFVDSFSHSGQISLLRVINERSTGNITLSHLYSENDNKVESRVSNLQGGGSYRFSETLSASLSGGVRHTETKYPSDRQIFIISPPNGFEALIIPVEVENDDDGYVFNGKISKQFLRGGLSLGASRDVTTQTSGLLVEVSRVNLDTSYRLSEKLATAVQLQAYRSETANPDGTIDKREYYTASPSLNWAFDRFWRLSASYRYNKQTYEDSNNDAVQNAAYLTLSYDWPRISTSR